MSHEKEETRLDWMPFELEFIDTFVILLMNMHMFLVP